MTGDGLAALYRRYNACCNEHRVEDLAQFVSDAVAIDGPVRGLDAYTADCECDSRVPGLPLEAAPPRCGPAVDRRPPDR